MNSFKTVNVDTTSLDALTRAALSVSESYMRSLSEFARLAMSTNPVLSALKDMTPVKSCHIPPPCWLPRSLGEIRSLVCPGGTASVRIRVTNGHVQSSTVQAAFAKIEFQGTVAPASATLDPLERKSYTASFAAPATAGNGQQFETLLWVMGCNDYYLRWIVEVSDNACQSCHEIEIDDAPDHVHHWYDHFYRQRRCFHPRTVTGESSPGSN